MDGLTKGISNADYHGSDELSRSTASDLTTTSPAKVRYERDNPLTYKGVPLIMGGCFHGMVLEPECLDEEYAVKPTEIDGKSPLTKHYKEEFAGMQMERPDAQWLKADDWETCKGMAYAVLDNPVYTHYASDIDAIAEGTGHFDYNGAKCKVRPDLYTSDGTIIDLKSTMDASEAGFRKSVRNFSYAFQACWYLEAMRALGLPAKQFVFIAVDKVAPFGVASYTLTESEIDRQKPRMQKACEIWATCMETGVWPGYPEEVVTLDLSRYGDNHKLSLSQVAEKFGVSRSFVYTIIKEFELETTNVGNQRRVDLTAFSNALRNHNEGKNAA
jgi:excisionase family DNA binding protein